MSRNLQMGRNAKYITDSTKAELKRTGKFSPPQRLTSTARVGIIRVKRSPPKDWKPRPPKKTILPKNRSIRASI